MSGLENDRITCSVRDAMAITSLGKTKMFELMATGQVRTVKVGRRRLVRMDSLRELLTNVPPNVSSADRSEHERTAEDIKREIIELIQRDMNRSGLERTKT